MHGLWDPKMRPPPRYVTSGNLISEGVDASSGDRLIRHRITGEGLQVSTEGVRLLGEFRRPMGIQEAIRHFDLRDPAEARAFRRYLMLFRRVLFLVPTGRESTESGRRLRKLLQADPFAISLPTFGRVPASKVADIGQGDFVIAGVGIDFGTTGRPGTRYGPARLREVASRFLSWESDPFSNRGRGVYLAEAGGVILKGARIVDVGDLVVEAAGKPDFVLARCHDAAMRIFARGAIPVFLGGDHSISAPLIRACTQRYGNLNVVHLDAHTDMNDWSPGTSHHHGSVMARVLAENPGIEIFQYGVRGLCGEHAPSARVHTVHQRDVPRSLSATGHTASPKGKPCYLSLDVDVLDPVYAPGTGTPVPFGMTPTLLLRLLERISTANRVVGMDFVELNPEADRDDVTASLLVHLLLCVLGWVHAHSGA